MPLSESLGADALLRGRRRALRQALQAVEAAGNAEIRLHRCPGLLLHWGGIAAGVALRPGDPDLADRGGLLTDAFLQDARRILRRLAQALPPGAYPIDAAPRTSAHRRLPQEPSR